MSVTDEKLKGIRQILKICPNIASDINNLKAGLNLLKILSKRLFKFLTLLANIILY